MITFFQFLNEANAAGSKFERLVAAAVQKWINKVGLQNRYKASRFQNVAESLGKRDEDYSDVIVEDLKLGNFFFIECKKAVTDNIVTTMFDFHKKDEFDTLTLVPVEGKSRTRLKFSNADPRFALADALMKTPGFKSFSAFLQKHCKLLNATPMQLLLNDFDITDDILEKLIKKYNSLVDAGKTEADCKKFDLKMIRESTRNMLALGLAWRLVDETHTWDICKCTNVNFAPLIRHHYMSEKAAPVKYLQLGKKLTYKFQDDDPLKVNCLKLPSDIHGKFWLKFTPRFGTGSMYIAPRSGIQEKKLPQSTSFIKT